MQNSHDNHNDHTTPDNQPPQPVFGDVKGDFFAPTENPFRSQPAASSAPADSTISSSDESQPPFSSPPPAPQSDFSSLEQAPIPPPHSGYTPQANNPQPPQPPYAAPPYPPQNSGQPSPPYSPYFTPPSPNKPKPKTGLIAGLVIIVLACLIFIPSIIGSMAKGGDTASISGSIQEPESVPINPYGFYEAPKTDEDSADRFGEPAPFVVTHFDAGVADATLIQDVVCVDTKDGAFLVLSSGATIGLGEDSIVDNSIRISQDRQSLFALVNKSYLYQFFPDGTSTLIAENVTDCTLSPTGGYLFYHSTQEGSFFYRRPVNGNNYDYSIAADSFKKVGFSPNGERLVYAQNDTLFSWSNQEGEHSLNIGMSATSTPLGISDDGSIAYYSRSTLSSYNDLFAKDKAVGLPSLTTGLSYSIHIVNTQTNAEEAAVSLGSRTSTAHIYTNRTGNELFIPAENEMHCFNNGSLLSSSSGYAPNLPPLGRYAPLYTTQNDNIQFSITSAENFNSIWGYEYKDGAYCLVYWAPEADTVEQLDQVEWPTIHVSTTSDTALALTQKESTNDTLTRYTASGADSIDKTLIASNVDEFSCSEDGSVVYYLSLPEGLDRKDDEDRSKYQLFCSSPQGTQMLAEQGHSGGYTLPFLYASPDGNSCVCRFITEEDGQHSYLYRKNGTPSMLHLSQRYPNILSSPINNNATFFFIAPVILQEENDIPSLYFCDGTQVITVFDEIFK